MFSIVPKCSSPTVGAVGATLCHFASGTKDCFHFIVSPADNVFAGAVLLPAIVGDTTVGMCVFL